MPPPIPTKNSYEAWSYQLLHILAQLGCGVFAFWFVWLIMTGGWDRHLVGAFAGAMVTAGMSIWFKGQVQDARNQDVKVAKEAEAAGKEPNPWQ
jgi:hypothetical protein